MIRYLILAAIVSVAFATLPSFAKPQESSPPATKLYDRPGPELQSRQGEEPRERDGSAPIEPTRLQWKLQSGQRLYQELIVTQKSQCQVQGLEVVTGLKYLVLSTFFVEELASDGRITIRQKIEATRLLQADAIAQPIFADLLKKLAGTTFRLTLSPQMQIVALEADEDAFPITAAGNPAAGQPLIMASLVDRDGWRELGQLTFFQPDTAVKPGQRWQRPLTHSWGPLGSWTGQVEYRYEDERDGLAQVVYNHELVYQPPHAAAAGDLPFRPTETTFQVEKAGGMIFFDRNRGRVERAAESFHVCGSMSIEVLGQKIPVAIVEQQDFQLRIYENRLGSRQEQPEPFGVAQ